MKIILSRKGFDKGSGGGPSPHIIETGELYSIPIPGEDSDYYSYADLRFSESMSCRDLMAQLGISTLDMHAHTDPDLRHNLFYDPDPNWMPMFGQQGHPQGHLRNQGIKKGDIFLFYGLYQDVQQINERYSFIPGTEKQIIWGYMQIGDDPVDITGNPNNYRHPHYFNWKNYSSRNTAYHAAECLSFAQNVPGYGVFRFGRDLVLSQNCGDKCTIYNRWQLPLHFYEHRMSGNKDWRWSIEEDHCILQAANRGQEFVIDDERAVKWAEELILSNVIKNT